MTWQFALDTGLLPPDGTIPVLALAGATRFAWHTEAGVDVLLEKPIATTLAEADELIALAGKVAAGTATDEDKVRLRKLAAAV